MRNETKELKINGHRKERERVVFFYLVQSSVKIDDNLAGTMIVDDLELADVAVLHHDGEKLDNDLGARPEQHLTLVAFLGVVERLERVGQRIHANHFLVTLLFEN